MLLRSADDELRDLADGSPALFDAGSGAPTGLRLLRWLGAGGTAAVFLTELDPASRSALLSRDTPGRLVVKIMKPTTERHLDQMGLSLLDIARREITALRRVMSRRPPTEHIVSLFGSGTAEVQTGARKRLLPWLALELVDGDRAGATLTDRVTRAPDGIDPVRALRLTRGILEGVRIFHELNILHRDLKPDNVFVAGPLDDETPKIADCGIARVSGLSGGTIAAMTEAYGGPEQALSFVRPTAQNPLLGPWTDVHALAATVWFVLGGEAWCRGRTDWDAGERRPLRAASRLHRGFVEAGADLDAIDAALRRGASHRLPEAAWRASGAEEYERPARQRFGASMFAQGPLRPASVDDFAADLLPLLERCAARWVDQAGRENRPVTQFRPTRVLTGPPPSRSATWEGVPNLAEARSIAGSDAQLGEGLAPATPEGVVFLPGYGGFVRFGDRIVYAPFAGESPVKVPVPPEHRGAVAASRWLVRGPGLGIALVGPSHVLLLRRGRFDAMPLPVRSSGGEVGEVQAAVGDGRFFGVVTAETDDSNGGPELWSSTDGLSWSGPTILPLGGDVHALSPGPFGLLAVGSSAGRRGERRARAMFLGLDRQKQVITDGVNDKPALVAAVSGATREAWAAGAGVVLRFDLGGAAREAADFEGRPSAMGLDLEGIPWLVTEPRVLRRHDGGGSARWVTYYEREAGEAPFVAIGFDAEGVRVMDARGGGVLLVPRVTVD